MKLKEIYIDERNTIKANYDESFFQLYDYNDGALIELDEIEANNLIEMLNNYLNRPKEFYYLWKGEDGTIIDTLTTEEDLPSIMVGGGGKRAKFEKISRAFYKDSNGNFQLAD